jgi:aryl-alcohol dehydrogenase-like predicted oxidoreductase
MHHKLILGTVQLGLPYGVNNRHGQPDEETAREILRRAWEGGIRAIDTADAYGSSMERIGAFHEATPEARFRVITKFHAGDDDSDDALRAKALSACEKLCVERLRCYQYHRFSDIAAFPRYERQLRLLKEQNIIERVGASVYTNEEIEAAAAIPFLDVIQFPFNALDNINIRGEAMRRAKENGKELHARSVFLQGLFFKSAADFPPKLAPLLPYIQKLQSLAENAGGANSLRELALNYALRQPLLDGVLVGVETPRQIEELLAAVRPETDSAVYRALEKIDEEIHVQTPELLNPAHW